MRYVFKPLHRSVPVVGPWIAEVAADEALRVVVDGTGLVDRNGDRLPEHLTQTETQWIVSQEEVGEGLVFDFGQAVELETLQIWNYNEPGYTSRGVAQADVSVWTSEGDWKTVLRGASLQEAEGTDQYDEPTLLRLVPTRAEKVRLSNLKPFADEGFVGLSAIRFYEKATLAACNPQPPGGASLPFSSQATLFWTPGKEAAAYDVYAGIDGQEPAFLGRIAESQVKLVGLVGERTYRWRIDAVQTNGTVTQGPLWSFSVEPGRCVAHWPFDEHEGQTAADSLGQAAGVLRGEPAWLIDGGRIDGAIELDGQRDFVETPALHLNTDTLTMTVWLRADPPPNQLTGVMFCRTPSTVAGIHLSGTNLRYHWNDLPESYNWDSGLSLPTDGRWVFAALTVTPESARLYLHHDGELKTAENRLVHSVQPFDGPLTLGCDGGINDRNFKGRMDDARVYNYALTAEQILALAEGREPADYASDAAPSLALAGAELIQRDADLKAIAEARQRERQAAPPAEVRRRNILPVLVIVALIAAAAVVLGRKSA